MAVAAGIKFPAFRKKEKTKTKTRDKKQKKTKKVGVGGGGTHARIVKIGDSRFGEDASKESGNVGRVAGQEDDAESAPDVDEELVGPRFGCLKGHQVAEEEAPHDPKGGGKAKVFRPLSTPRIETERTEPLVDGHGQRCQIETDEDADPQIGTERFEEGQQRDIIVVDLAGLQDGQPRIEVRNREIDGFAPGGRHAQRSEAQMGSP